jgi:REP element-mobilizing transposase RayT
MPNHIHGIISVSKGAGEDIQNNPDLNFPLRPYAKAQVIPGSLGAIVRAYKSSVTFRINASRGVSTPPIWQRNYYDHIIRNENDYQNIWNYIEANPEKWEEDQFHFPLHPSRDSRSMKNHAK